MVAEKITSAFTAPTGKIKRGSENYSFGENWGSRSKSRRSNTNAEHPNKMMPAFDEQESVLGGVQPKHASALHM